MLSTSKTRILNIILGATLVVMGIALQFWALYMNNKCMYCLASRFTLLLSGFCILGLGKKLADWGLFGASFLGIWLALQKMTGHKIALLMVLFNSDTLGFPVALDWDDLAWLPGTLVFWSFILNIGLFCLAISRLIVEIKHVFIRVTALLILGNFTVLADCDECTQHAIRKYNNRQAVYEHYKKLQQKYKNFDQNKLIRKHKYVEKNLKLAQREAKKHSKRIAKKYGDMMKRVDRIDQSLIARRIDPKGKTRPVGKKLYVCLSSSMPQSLVNSVVGQFKNQEVEFVIKGFMAGGIKPTIQWMAKFYCQTKRNISIDPELFKKYKVVQAPCYIVVEGDSWHKITGSVNWREMQTIMGIE